MVRLMNINELVWEYMHSRHQKLKAFKFLTLTTAGFNQTEQYDYIKQTT